jgi:hypothetical protein
MKKYLIFLILLLVLAAVSRAADLSVGVSPSVVNVGDVERGSGKIVKFYIVTVSNDAMLVTLQPETGSMDFFKGGYADLIHNFSEEDASGWVEFFSNPVELIPDQTGTLKGFREVNFLVDVPRNAEPGYHLISIKPLPEVPEEAVGGEAGTVLVAVTSVQILFKAPGEAKREGIILDVNSGGYINGKNNIDTYFQNTGTVTISAYASQQVYDKDGNHIADLRSTKEYVKSGETKKLRSVLVAGIGEYTIHTTVNYRTGVADKTSDIIIAAPTGMAAAPETESNPMLLIILIIIIIIVVAVFIYRRIA